MAAAAAEQPIFYPVLNRDYAIKIARDWNAPRDGVGYVTRFQVRAEFLTRYQMQQVGGRTILEYWIPAEDLNELNANLVGVIEVTDEFVVADQCRELALIRWPPPGSEVRELLAALVIGELAEVLPVLGQQVEGHVAGRRPGWCGALAAVCEPLLKSLEAEPSVCPDDRFAIEDGARLKVNRGCGRQVWQG